MCPPVFLFLASFLVSAPRNPKEEERGPPDASGPPYERGFSLQYSAECCSSSR